MVELWLNLVPFRLPLVLMAPEFFLIVYLLVFVLTFVCPCEAHRLIHAAFKFQISDRCIFEKGTCVVEHGNPTNDFC